MRSWKIRLIIDHTGGSDTARLDFRDRLSRFSLKYSSRVAEWKSSLPLISVYNHFILHDGIAPQASELLEPSERLVVQRVIYGSPGIKDVAGIAEIVGHLTDFLLRLIEIHSSRRERELKNERAELENERLKLENEEKKFENAKKFLDVAESYGYTKKEKRILMAMAMREQESLLHLIEAGKISEKLVRYLGADDKFWPRWIFFAEKHGVDL